MTTVIEMRGITMAFGANEVLKGIDLDLESGKVTAMLGANGAGKSTSSRFSQAYTTDTAAPS